ncbi:nucleotidyl transferase AbiEii/AbiGii toxin family protein [Geodermatophilus sp. TF02-6]|nr:nucleotidyl transferase AbiEii/AbiGii toxin family protein [Geodermatophilus sp. TF02-6]
MINQARAQGADASRLRRRLVFQRVLRRLAVDDRWVLKGGFLLEARLAARARTTRDLDLVSVYAGDLDELRHALEVALEHDPDGDFLRFAVTGTGSLRPDDAGVGGWRLSVDVRLAGRTFDRVRIDVVGRVDETSGGIETVELVSPVSGLDFRPAVVRAVDVAQHAAEKYHAVCRTYAGDRPSTRVKDLVDLVLLAEAGLLPAAHLGDRLRPVFASRDGHDPPPELPDPPAAWRHDYAFLADDLGLAAGTVEEAMAVASDVYRRALA